MGSRPRKTDKAARRCYSSSAMAIRSCVPILFLVCLTLACSSKSSSRSTSSGGSAGASGAAGGGSGGTAGSGGTSGSGGTGGNACGLGPDAGPIGKWPDSKTKFCTGACGPGEDGSSQIHVPVYTTNGNEVTDPITGLVWQKNYGAARQWTEAVPYCDGLGIGWRVPSRVEVVSLLDHGAAYALPAEFDMPGDNPNLWTSTTTAKVDDAWVINVQNGDAGTWHKTTDFPVRCVKGPALTAAPFTSDSSCGVVSSVSTGLMWERSPADAKHSWSAALDHCATLAVAGLDDWRVPTAKELATIVDDTTQFPAVSPTAFAGTHPEPYWSSTPYFSLSSEARFVNFNDGTNFDGSDPNKPFADTLRVRCVRNLP